jgi:hypothetical protein
VGANGAAAIVQSALEGLEVLPSIFIKILKYKRIIASGSRCAPLLCGPEL